MIRIKHFFSKSEERWLLTMGSEKQNPSDPLPQAAAQHHPGARDACRLQGQGDTPEEQSALLWRVPSTWQKAEVFEGGDTEILRTAIITPSRKLSKP